MKYISVRINVLTSITIYIHTTKIHTHATNFNSVNNKKKKKTTTYLDK
jgi:hypothetical protein